MSKTKSNRVSVWADSDSDSETGGASKENIIQTFLIAKNFFEPELRFIDSNDEENELQQENQPLPMQIPIENNCDDNKDNVNDAFLQKKKERDPDEAIEVEGGEIGPHPITIEYDKKEQRKLYQGMNINPTEAQLYAQYIQRGKRIPRRGEVGISSNEIEYLESIGYVMSGTRHKKMNAARQRIEGKVYSAEDKRALSIFNLEENLKKEKNIINAFMTMLKKSNKDQSNGNEKEDNV